jgi:1,4-dihydroxy-2-naphthoyl-CoA hydrolase
VSVNSESIGRDALGELIGIEHLDPGDADARARVPVTDDVVQIHGLVHGGVYSTLAETVCSTAANAAVRGDGKVAFGQSNHTTLLRSISDGHVNAAAHVRHRGRTTWVWQVEMTDDEGRLCALSQVVVAVRERG